MTVDRRLVAQTVVDISRDTPGAATLRFDCSHFDQASS